MPQHVSIHDAEQFEHLCGARGIDVRVLRRVRTAFYKKLRPPEEILDSLPDSARDVFGRLVAFRHLRLRHRADSTCDGSTKLVFECDDGCPIESVILRMASGRTSLCVSSQAGCAGKCRFCATGQMGFSRDLTTGEILDQVIHANQLIASESREARNIVFMGMGEPLLNEAALFGALEVLLSPRCFAAPAKKLMVSTVGIPDAMMRFAARFPSVRLAVSLHSARAAVRRQLMPLSRQHDPATLRDAIREVARLQGQDVMIEVLMLHGVTDTDDDLAELKRYLHGVPAWVNLIPFNPVACAPELTATPPARMAEFADALKACGYWVTVRQSLGADIGAACGQLAGQRAGTAS